MVSRLNSAVAVALALAWPLASKAQTVITSAAPDRVAVTIYRAPGQGAGQAMDLRWLRGYALITEQRAVDLPAGRATVRFEGVAGGMLPESVIVRGLPAEVREKNLDADLLTPQSLYAHTLGRPVILRRQHPKTGETTEEPAIVRSSPEGGVILETRAGYEAANCGPLQDSLLYSRAPAGLSAKPTLSIETDAPTPVRATLSVSYLAWGFDWRTNYVVTMQPGERRAELAAWVTLASSDATSFPAATLAVVAGEVNREERGRRQQQESEPLVFRCYLSALTAYAPPAPMAVRVEEPALGEIVVTARRRADVADAYAASIEDLGDLKLYRAPFDATVAAKAQKQVAMFTPRRVRLAPVYVAALDASAQREPAVQAVRLELHGRNREADGLGLPLPSGQVAVLERWADTDVLIGEGVLPDKAVDERLEINIAAATQVAVSAQRRRVDHDTRYVEMQVSNANPWPISFEAPIQIAADERLEASSVRLATKNAQPLWRTRVPANGRAKLRFRVAVK